MRYSVVNLGCKVNRVESDAYEEVLSAHGAPAVPGEETDIVIVNTCTVTGEAEKKTRKTVRHVLKEHPRARVVVTGCAAAIDPVEFETMDARVTCVPKADMKRYLTALVGASNTDYAASRMRVGVKVQDGCNHACTYCIVHIARGPAWSLPVNDILDHCVRLARAGIPEIVLTGINLGSYNQDGFNLTGLLTRIMSELDKQAPYPLISDAAFTGPRIRLSSIEPMDVDDALMDLLATSSGRICRHLHLPLQSGSSKVLREMARPYNAEEFVAKVARLRDALPSLALTTDIIVGFPGETEDDFSQTREVAHKCGFSGMHVFPYSMRRGTPAAERTDQVDPALKDQRAALLRELGHTLAKEDQHKRQNTQELAAVEEQGFARTESYYKVPVSDSFKPGALMEYTFDTCDSM